MQGRDSPALHASIPFSESLRAEEDIYSFCRVENITDEGKKHLEADLVWIKGSTPFDFIRFDSIYIAIAQPAVAIETWDVLQLTDHAEAFLILLYIALKLFSLILIKYLRRRLTPCQG